MEKTGLERRRKEWRAQMLQTSFQQSLLMPRWSSKLWVQESLHFQNYYSNVVYILMPLNSLYSSVDWGCWRRRGSRIICWWRRNSSAIRLQDIQWQYFNDVLAILQCCTIWILVYCHDFYEHVSRRGWSPKRRKMKRNEPRSIVISMVLSISLHWDIVLFVQMVRPDRNIFMFGSRWMIWGETLCLLATWRRSLMTIMQSCPQGSWMELPCLVMEDVLEFL